MKTIRLTMAQALVRWLCAQRTVLDGADAPLFGGVFAIFGHGNVTCLGEALEAVQDQLPTWRGQNEQSMALAGDRLRQGQEAAPDHGRDQLDRPGRHEHGDRRRRRAQQPPADPAAVRRHLRQSRARPGAAAGRALRRSDDHRQRRVQGGDPLLGPDQPARADHRARCPRRSRPCSIRPTAGRRSSACARTPRPRRSTTPRRSSSRRSGACRGRGPTSSSWSRRPSCCARRTSP